MKPHAIILISADTKLQQATMAAAGESRRALRLTATVQDTLNLLQSSMDDVDLIILDLDSDICGVMLLNALAFCCERIPVATVTSFERDYTLPIALSKGAVACLGKPVSAAELTALVNRVCGCAQVKGNDETLRKTVFPMTKMEPLRHSSFVLRRKGDA